MFEYAIDVYDGARIFPVHGAWYVCINTQTCSIMISIFVFCSGLWGVLCVGIFSKGCLIREVYDHLCFCVTSELPDVVRYAACLRNYVDTV